MSIFSKICPRCAGDNPVEVTHCQCGYVFEASATTGSYRALEIAEQEAQVYAEYLQARMSQAKESAEVAINDQAHSPKDANKAAVAKSANDEYHVAKVEYHEQMKLVLELRKEAKKTQVLEHKEQKSAWEKAKERTRHKSIKVKEEAAANKNKQEQKRLTATKKAEKTRQQKLQAEAAAKASADKLALRASNRTSPPPKMKKKMAREAEAAATRVRQAQSSIEKEIAAATSALNTSVGIATHADHASAPRQKSSSKNDSAISDNIALILTNTKTATHTNEKECPNCTAIVSVAAKKCKCGYGFPQSAELMDSIGLSDEERVNLLNMLQPGNDT
ncbi:MAG: zinc ribbon domain-containing protein [Acidiferrobacterales bacterium]